MIKQHTSTHPHLALRHTCASGGNTSTSFTGLAKGTLTIGAGSNSTTLAYDPNPVKSNKQSFSDAIKMGWWGFKDIWSDPKISEIRDNVLTGFSFAIGAGELKSGIEFWKVMGVLNDVDDLLKGSDNIKDKNLKKFVTSFKMVVDYKGLQNTSIESLTDKKISPTQAASLAFDAKGVLDSANLLKEQVDSKSTKKKSD